MRSGVFGLLDLEGRNSYGEWILGSGILNYNLSDGGTVNIAGSGGVAAGDDFVSEIIIGSEGELYNHEVCVSGLSEWENELVTSFYGLIDSSDGEYACKSCVGHGDSEL